MPIYAYKCSACGFAKDTLQKMSDPPLTVCPECGQETFSKQVTAAGFQLKGSGWYVTDFRNNGNATAGGGNSQSGTKSSTAADGKTTAAGENSTGAAAPAPAAGGKVEAASGASGSTGAAPAAASKPASGSAPSA